MNRIKQILLLGTLVFLSNSSMMAQKHAKGYQYDYYPAEYEAINDWNSLQQILDRSLAMGSLQTIRENEVRREAWFALARIKRINWKGNDKAIVSQYLENYIETLLGEQSFLKNLGQLNPDFEDISSDPIFLPHKATWALLYVDEKRGHQLIPDLWATTFAKGQSGYLSSFRRGSLVAISHRNAKSKEAKECLESLRGQYSNKVKPKVNQDLDQLLSNFTLLEQGSQGKAWKYLWEEHKRERLEELLNLPYQELWYTRMLLMRKSYQPLDPRKAFELAKKASAPQEQYIFLYTACALLNFEIATEGMNNRAFAEELQAAVRTYYETHGETIEAIAEARDYLQTTFESLNEKVNQN